MSDQKRKESIMQCLPLVNTVFIAIFVVFVGYKMWGISDSVIEYMESAKKLNDTLKTEVNSLGTNLNSNVVKQFENLKMSVFDPINTGVVKPLSDASKNIKSLTTLIGNRSILFQKRASENEKFAKLVLSQLKVSDLTIYAEELDDNSEPSDLWAERAEVEVEIIKWLAWNEKDLLYRLSVKDTGVDIDLIDGAHLRRWMVKRNGRDQQLYDWFIENNIISKELERLGNRNR